MPEIHTSELARFHAAIHDKGGNPYHPDVVSEFHPLDLQFDTVVDQTLSPYSDEYFDQQVALYREISGRELNQSEGELHPIDPRPLEVAPNPLNIRIVSDAVEHMRPLATMLALADLNGPTSRVLDMGAGHGFSSEIFATCGCTVDAVDIDPVLSQLSRTRAAARGLDVTRLEMSFDNLASIEPLAYDAAFFFQSLHHCLRPWDLIAQLRTKLRPGAVIGFCGEPIQDIWWRHWGLRLDAESLFVAHGLGWFESGWSREFIVDCFARNGMRLDLYNGGSHGGSIGIASDSTEKLASIQKLADRMGLRQQEASDAINFADTDFFSITGIRTHAFGRPAFRQRHGGIGCLIYGPYATLDVGTYEFSMIIAAESGAPTIVSIDIVGEGTDEALFLNDYHLSAGGSPNLITGRFTIAEKLRRVEVRTATTVDQGLVATLPALRMIVNGQTDKVSGDC